MSLGVFLAVVGAAFLHALWNALIRSGTSGLRGMVVLTLVLAGIGVLLAVGHAPPPPAVWPWLLASGVVHAAYKGFLVYAYGHGDLSRVYPISRGAAPMAVLIISLIWLDDPVSTGALIGVLVLGCGILLMARGAWTRGESRRLLPFALGAAAATAAYTLIDGAGARLWGTPLAYVSWLFVIDALIFCPVVAWFRGAAAFQLAPRGWALGTLAGLAAFMAYAVAIWAMTEAPIALVAALRETSILFAVLIGWLVLGERMDRGKAVSALLILCGAVLMRL